MKQKFYDGQLVRVIGDCRCFFVGRWGEDETDSSRWYENAREKKWWPEYLLESAE